MTSKAIYGMEGQGGLQSMHRMGEALPDQPPPPYSDVPPEFDYGSATPVEPQTQSGQPYYPPPPSTTYIPATGVLTGYSSSAMPSGPQVHVLPSPPPLSTGVKYSDYKVPPPQPATAYQMASTAYRPGLSPVSPASSLATPQQTLMLPQQPSLYIPHSQGIQPTLHRPHSQVFTTPPMQFDPPPGNRPHSVYVPVPPQTPIYQPQTPSPTPMHHPVPQRPPMEHLFSEPYIAPAHSIQQQAPSFQTPQYEHSFAEPGYDGNGALAPPMVSLRPVSAPIPEQLPQAPVAYQESIVFSQGDKDDRQASFGQRFVGNMLFVRAARSGLQSTISTAKLPFYLSPWGDNNPITLPNVRIRDIALLGLAHVGLDALAAGSMELMEPIVQHAVTMTVEQAAHHGIEGAQSLKAKKATQVVQRGGVNSLLIKVKHKLMGADAILQMLGERETTNRYGYEKGWFCPYLYATSRAPRVARGKDFSIAQFYGPGLAADASLAPLLLTALTPIAPLHSLCATDPTPPSLPRYRRIILCVLAIGPPRTKSWNQSRIPNEGRFSMHVFSAVPALVVPVKASAPICAWSAWTVSQMLESAAIAALAGTGMIGAEAAKNGYEMQKHYYELLEFVDKVVDPDLIREEDKADWKVKAAKAVWEMINRVKAWGALWRTGQMGKVVDVERAGVVAFRF